MAQKKEWKEGELILTFGLNKIVGVQTALMTEWLNVENPIFSVGEQYYFDKIYQKSLMAMSSWSEEDLKMKFISPILELGNLLEDKVFASFFDKKLEAKVKGHHLSVKADFLIAKGLLDFMERPFFHFQEYKPQKNPTGDPMAQLLEAFLIAQAKNNDGKPLYGCEVVGRNWTFVIMENQDYCISSSFDALNKAHLLKIISILRKFRSILELQLLV